MNPSRPKKNILYHDATMPQLEALRDLLPEVFRLHPVYPLLLLEDPARWSQATQLPFKEEMMYWVAFIGDASLASAFRMQGDVLLHALGWHGATYREQWGADTYARVREFMEAVRYGQSGTALSLYESVNFPDSSVIAGRLHEMVAEVVHRCKVASYHYEQPDQSLLVGGGFWTHAVFLMTTSMRSRSSADEVGFVSHRFLKLRKMFTEWVWRVYDNPLCESEEKAR